MKKALSNSIRGCLVCAAIGIYCLFPVPIHAEEIKITGSTTFAPLVTALSEAFMAKNPSIKIVFTQSNAAESISSIIDGQVDIGCSARYLKVTESQKAESKGINLKCYSAALDCIFPIVHPSNKIKSLGLGQLASVFKGNIANWNNFDYGENVNIKVISRESGSAMYEFWSEKIMHDDTLVSGAVTLRSNQEIVDTVAKDPAAIGYTSYSYLSDKVRTVPLTGLETVQVPTDTHPLSRKLLMCTNGNASKSVEQFIEFMNGADGKAVMRKAGFLPL